MQVRWWVRVLHRDVGYLLVGLVVFYAASGVAVNHIADWNPNYSTLVSSLELGPLEGRTLDALEKEVVARARLDPDEVAGRHRPDAATFVVFLPHGGEVKVDVESGRATLTRVRTRPLLFEANVLHLNHLKGLWTWVADVFAVLLAGLAITGMFMIKGKKGLAGRGKWLVSAGFLLPVAFLVLYYSTR